MSSYHCYLCASDDEMLLDIFGYGGTAICGNIETCLSVKVDKSDALSSKICHKCAYELDTCGKFVQKYRQARDVPLSKSIVVKGHCCLCLEPGRKGYIFDCTGGDSVHNSLYKIQELFDDSVFKDKRRHLSICLDCRYHLDLLYDLKSIYQTTPAKLRRLNEKGLELSELPKTRTRVVNRKTTYASSPRLRSRRSSNVSDMDSSSTGSSGTMPLKRKRGRPRKDSNLAASSSFRYCQQCDIAVENGIDMYKYHRTGLTVCKECWLAMDSEVAHGKRKKLGTAGGDVGTRRCAIILKDVMTNPAKYENFYKVEKDEHGNTTFIVTDDSSENDEREKLPVRRSQRNLGVVASVESPSTKKSRPPKRIADGKSTDREDEPPEKIKIAGKKVADEKSPTSTRTRTRNSVVISDTEVVTGARRRSAGQPADGPKRAKAASDPELPKPQATKKALRLKLEKPEPAAPPPDETKPAAALRPRRAAKAAAAVVSTSEPTERPVRRKRTTSLTSQDKVSLSSRLSTMTRSTKSVSEIVSSPTKTRKSKSKSVSPKNSGSEVELEKPYVCGVCNVEYRNKLIGMKHELTHAKQPEVKLQRVTIPKIIVEEASPELSLIEEPEEQSHDISSSSDRRVEAREDVEKDSREEASVDAAETTEKNEISEERKSAAEADVADAKVGDASGEEEAKVTNTADKVEDKIESKTDRVEEKTEGEADKKEDKTEGKADQAEDKSDKLEDKTEGEADPVENKSDAVEDKTEGEANQVEEKSNEVEEKVEDKGDIVEDKTEDNVDKVEDKADAKDKNEDTADAIDKNEITVEAMDENEDEADAKSEDEEKTDIKDKNRSKADTEDSHEEKVDVNHKTENEPSEATESEATAKDEECLENSVENAREDKMNNKSIITEADEDKEEKKKEKTTGEAVDSENSESTQTEEVEKKVEKKVESPGIPEKFSEKVLNEITESSANVNGVNVEDDSIPKVDEENEVAKATPDDAESKVINVHNAEESAEPRSVALVTSTADEQESEDKDVEENFVLQDDETPKNSEVAVEAATNEDPDVRENSTTKKNEEPESVAKDVLSEVFDLATAEVRKRMENKPRDENCTTPVSETLENISREINNSADMPSLEPLVDDHSSNNRS